MSLIRPPLSLLLRRGNVGELLPFGGVILEVGEGVYCDLEVGTCTAGEEILIDFLERYTLVEVNILLLQASLFQDQDRHVLAEQFSHDIHASLAGGHVTYGVTHCEEDSLHAAGLRGVVQLGEALGYVADTYEGRVRERLLEGFFEAVEPGHSAEREMLFAGELVAGGKVGEEL